VKYKLKNNPKILVIKLSSLGDVFHPLPAVHIIKKELNATIDWVTTDIYADLVKSFTDIDRVISFRRRSFFSNLKSFLKELRQEKYDLIIDFQGLMKSAMVAMLARGKVRIGPSFNREGSRIFYSAVAGKEKPERHAVDQCMDIIRYLDLPETEISFPVKYPSSSGDFIVKGSATDESLLEKHPAIALLPRSRWETKNWPLEYFIKLAQLLNETVAGSLFLIGGPDDKNACATIESQVGDGIINLAGKMSLSETGAALEKMDLLITNDSGPMHMAAASGVPCLALFGPTDAGRTGPYGDIHKVMMEEIDCRPCYSRACKLDEQTCLRDISPESVCKEALAMLKLEV
jgi:lipopolysaccharide heptosyltransferase I